MPAVIDPKVILSKSPAAIRKALDVLMAETEMPGYWGIVERTERGLARIVARHNPRAGYYLGAFMTLRALATRRAMGAAFPAVLETAWQVAQEVPDATTPANLTKLKTRLYRLVPSADEEANYKKLNAQFLALHKVAVKNKLFPAEITIFDILRDAVLAAQEASGGEPVPSSETPQGPTDNELASTGSEATKTLKDDGIPRMRTRERREVIDLNPYEGQPPTPITSKVLISSPPWKTYGEELEPDPYWVRWTTVEWPPLARPEPHMAFIHDPVHDPNALPWAKKGDASAMTELPGGTILKGTDAIRYTNGHIGQTWHEKLQRYWVEMPERANFVRLGERIHFHIAQFLDSQGDFLDWSELRRLIEEQLEKQDVEEKIEEEAKKFLEEALSGAGSVLGQPLASAASPAAKAAAALAMEAIEWLIEEIFGRPDFGPIQTAHTTFYWPPTAPISSVAWSTTTGTSGQTKPLVPLKLKPRPPDTDVAALAKYLKLPLEKRYESIGEEMIEWLGESRVPEEGPMPARLVNTRTAPIFWPPSYDRGGHVFIPVMTEDGDGQYAVALRTEVRLAFVTFEP